MSPFATRDSRPKGAARTRRLVLVLCLMTALLTSLLSALACVILFSGVWQQAVDTSAMPKWALLGLQMLALTGPLGFAALVAFVALHARQQVAAAAAAARAQVQRRRALLTLLDSLPVAVALCNPRDGCGTPNRAMAELLQMEHGAPGLSIDWLQILSREDGAAWLATRDAALRSGRPQWLRSTLQISGAACPVVMQIAPFAGEEGVEVAVSLTLADGESGRTQETVLQLRELLALAEAEKWHFGQAVHDELGQRLSGMAYFAKALQCKLQKAQRAEADDAAWLTDLANESMAVARGLARGLLPVGTDDPGGLGAALADLCERAGKTFGIDCTLSVDPAFDAGGAAQASHLYHAIQELVTNAVKHGEAQKVQVSLDRLDDHQRATVRNDGKSLADTPARLGMGLLGVRSRAAYLGAQFTFTDEGPGTVLAVIDLPIDLPIGMQIDPKIDNPLASSLLEPPPPAP